MLEPCREVCRGEFHRAVGDHLHVTEPLVVEAGHELVVAAAERHYVGLEEVLGIGRAEVDIDVREVGVTVFAEPLGVDQPEPRAGLAPHAELRHAGHVLSEVIEVAGVVEPAYAAGFVAGDLADRHGLLRRDELRGGAAVADTRPGRVVESRTVPSRLFEPGVVVFRGVDAVEGERAARSFPVEPGGHCLFAAVVVDDAQVEAEGRAVAPRGPLEVPDRTRLVVVPSVAEQYADGVRPLAQLPRDVVGDVEVAAVVARIERVETVVAYPLAVEVELVEPGCGDVGTGRADRTSGRELLAEVGGRLVVDVAVVADPRALPVAGLHHAGLEDRDGGVVRHPFVVPERDAPVAAGEGLQRRAAVADEHPVRLHAPRVPQPASSGSYSRRVRADRDAAGALCGSLSVVVHAPAQARCGSVDAERGGQVFTPQVSRIARCGGGASGNQQQEGAKGLFSLFHRLSFFSGLIRDSGTENR